MGIFEPTIQMTGGTFNLNGDLVWFGEAPGSGTPKVKLIGGTTNFNGNIVNLDGSTVNMHLTISDSANVQFNGFSIFQTQPTDSIIQLGTGDLFINGPTSWSNNGVYWTQNTKISFNGDTELYGTGLYQFSTILIEENKSLTQRNAQNIYLNGNFINNGNFTTLTNRVYFNGSQSQHIGGTRTTTFNFLSFQNSSSSGVYLDTSIFIYGHLDLLDGFVFTTPEHKLTIYDNATSSEAGQTLLKKL